MKKEVKIAWIIVLITAIICLFLIVIIRNGQIERLNSQVTSLENRIENQEVELNELFEYIEDKFLLNSYLAEQVNDYLTDNDINYKVVQISDIIYDTTLDEYYINVVYTANDWNDDNDKIIIEKYWVYANYDGDIVIDFD